MVYSACSKAQPFPSYRRKTVSLVSQSKSLTNVVKNVGFVNMITIVENWVKRRGFLTRGESYDILFVSFPDIFSKAVVRTRCPFESWYRGQLSFEFLRLLSTLIVSIRGTRKRENKKIV